MLDSDNVQRRKGRLMNGNGMERKRLFQGRLYHPRIFFKPLQTTPSFSKACRSLAIIQTPFPNLQIKSSSYTNLLGCPVLKTMERNNLEHLSTGEPTHWPSDRNKLSWSWVGTSCCACIITTNDHNYM
jgi:hypothetical protein